ncbi:DUF6286 domain-containing protein [Quadrisphaera setariae]|uniref:DUF6286 domain-containing protein n=1 Tax=Quadrisphaera setariae TaxID=2593304 RepID=A0A5C8ZK07_9ACTN|nr:DUF6286 domain-containing protein [Quadrisphaera setariae]TXR57954.1 hypothetical protein FMM08_01645 [Quadrisphaera setariae]
MTTPTAPTSEGTRSRGQQATGQGSPLRPAALPTGAGTIGWLGPLLAVLLLGVAVVLGQDAWVRLNGGQSTWLGAVLSAPDGLAPATWLAAPAAVAVLLGLVLLVTAFARRKRRALVLRGDLGAHLTTNDVARLAAGAARQVDGVLDASATATRRKVTVDVTSTGDSATTSAVQRDVDRALSALVSPPRVTVSSSTSSKGA